MQVKDYYKILELPPSATLKEIKAAYRRLAHRYHPDKNAGDPYAAVQFEAIKEAYEVLTSPRRRESYLQQRWYNQSMGRKNDQPVVTPVSVLKQVMELERHVATIDVYRMDKEGLYNYICYLLADETIEKLNGFREPDTNASIIDSVLKSSRPLSWSLFQPLSQRLLKLDSSPAITAAIRHRAKQSHRAFSFARWEPWIVLFIVFLLCLLMYYFAK